MNDISVDLAKMYEANLSRVYGFFSYRLFVVADAEDLTASTFERAVRHAHRFDPDRASEATWLLAIAQNVLIDYFRRTGRRSEHLTDGSDLESVAEPGTIHDAASVGIEPELERALTGLGERERQVIALRFGGELRGHEIASLIGTSEANVHQILSRSLRQLRKEMPEVGAAFRRR